MKCIKASLRTQHSSIGMPRRLISSGRTQFHVQLSCHLLSHLMIGPVACMSSGWSRSRWRKSLKSLEYSNSKWKRWSNKCPANSQPTVKVLCLTFSVFSCPFSPWYLTVWPTNTYHFMKEAWTCFRPCCDTGLKSTQLQRKFRTESAYIYRDA